MLQKKLISVTKIHIISTDCAKEKSSVLDSFLYKIYMSISGLFPDVSLYIYLSLYQDEKIPITVYRGLIAKLKKDANLAIRRRLIELSAKW